MKILVGTQNRAKLDAVNTVFTDLYGDSTPTVYGASVASGVAEAPHGEDTYIGARNRAVACMEHFPDLAIGIESGLVWRCGVFFEETWVVMIGVDAKEYVAYSSGLPLPQVVIDRMKRDSHDKVMEQLDKELHLPPDNRNTWSRYTSGRLQRDTSIYEAIRNAAVQLPIDKRSLYSM